MRILAFVNNFPWPGTADGIFNLRQLTAVRSLGHEVRVVRWTPWSPPLGDRWRRYRSIPSSYAVDGIAVRTLRVLLGPRNIGIRAMRVQVRAHVQRIVREYEPDVVHVHGLIPAGILALDAGVPYVVTAHGTEAYRAPWTSREVERVARDVVTNASCTAAVSEFVASHVRRLGGSETRVIFNGADAGLFHPRDRASARARLKVALDRPVVSFVGHVDRPKGALVLRDAALRLRNLGVHVIFAGKDCGIQNEIARDFAAAGITATFLGVVDQHVLADVYAAADVCTLPSYAEGLPTVLCEAMNCGRAIVATKVGGVPEIVLDGKTGYLIEPGDAPALAERLNTILTEPSTRETFERAAVERAKTLTWESNAREYDAIYRAIASIDRRSHSAFRQ